jgi:CrcB protein
MLQNILIVGVGSFIGGVLRYIISLCMRNASAEFPWATLLVNIVGCFAIGLIYGLFARHTTTSHQLCLLLTTGVCGGFTTFSTFANESFQMLQNGNIAGFIAYVTTSIFVGIALIALTFWLVKIL